MDMAGNLGVIKRIWLNKCGVVSIVPLKVLKMIWPILYHFKKGMNPDHYIIHTEEGDIVLKNNSHGCRSCEDIPTPIFICCDSAFAHKKEFSIFKIPERFLEISCRDLIFFTLLTTLIGMVQANVGQKRLKRNILICFFHRSYAN